jgi:hypothetical protein
LERNLSFHPYKVGFSTSKQRTSTIKNPKPKIIHFWGRNSCTNPGYMDGAIFAANTIT